MYNTTNVNGKSPGEGAMTGEGFEGWILDHHGSVRVPQTAGRVCKVYAEHVRFKVITKHPEEIPTGRGDGKFLLWGEPEPETPFWQSDLSGGWVGKKEKCRERKKWERKKRGAWKITLQKGRRKVATNTAGKSKLIVSMGYNTART